MFIRVYIFLLNRQEWQSKFYSIVLNFYIEKKWKLPTFRWQESCLKLICLIFNKMLSNWIKFFLFLWFKSSSINILYSSKQNHYIFVWLYYLLVSKIINVAICYLGFILLSIFMLPFFLAFLLTITLNCCLIQHLWTALFCLSSIACRIHYARCMEIYYVKDNKAPLLKTKYRLCVDYTIFFEGFKAACI